VRSPLADTLAALAQALAGLRTRWYLFGAQAALIHGSARLTADVDVTVELGERPTSDLVAALQGAGFRLRVANADAFVARSRVLPFLHVASDMPVDVVLAGPGLEEAFLGRRKRRTIEGVRIHVACVEDLIVMKLLAGRAKDDDDVIAMLASARKLDSAMIRSTLRTLERALDRSDLASKFEELAVRAGRRPGRRV